MHLISRLALPVLHRWLVRRAAVLFAACTLSAAVFAQADNTQNGDNGNGNGGNGGGRRRGQNGQNGNGGGRGNFDPAQMQQQMIDRIREQLGVTDDAEWAVISERLNKVMELRRTASPIGGFNFRAFGGGQNGGGRRGGNAAANPEQEALTQAIADKLPDAEIKSRLERLREVRKKNEEALTKAQEDLRAVLSVRQEAAAVVAGLLP